jgi:protein involved in polysaccharide export with SLBB domain
MRLIRVGLFAFGLGVLLWCGCATSKPPGGGRAAAKPCSLDELRPGDMVTITFSDLPAMATPPEQKVRVKEDGTLSLPLNQSVTAATKSIAVVEKEIVALYVPKFYRQLSVTVKTDDRWYSVGGEVKSPGRQVYLGPTTVLRAIQGAGDFTDFAKRSGVRIHRADGRLEIIDCKKAIKNPKFDVPICPGDAINVPRRGV